MSGGEGVGRGRGGRSVRVGMGRIGGGGSVLRELKKGVVYTFKCFENLS